MTNRFSATFFDELKTAIDGLDLAAIEKATELLVGVRASGGRLFLLGVGGGAGHASHAVNDFRKIAEIEAYAPSDNVSELTARTNDEGWDTVYSAWLVVSKVGPKDLIFVFSVGGGDLDRNISPNLVRAVETARKAGARVICVVGRDGGYVGRIADATILVPTVNAAMITPYTESIQAVVWHLLVSDPRLQRITNKWETTAGAEHGERKG